MDRKRPDRGWRAASFAAALFAITLNFLQPLAHAALMRDGGPVASSLWTSMCLPGAGQDDQGSMPAAGKHHECCLGLAHAPGLVEPSTAFVAIDLPVAIVRPLEAAALAHARRHPRRAQPTASATLLRLTPEPARARSRSACVSSRHSKEISNVVVSQGDRRRPSRRSPSRRRPSRRRSGPRRRRRRSRPSPQPSGAGSSRRAPDGVSLAVGLPGGAQSDLSRARAQGR